MDLRLPDMDGTDAARRLASGRANGSIPVVALSALPLEGGGDWLDAAGFAGYLEKPINVGDVPGPGARATARATGAPARRRAHRASTPRSAGGHGRRARALLLTSAVSALDGSTPACEHRHVPVARRARTERRLTSMRTLLIGGALGVVVSGARGLRRLEHELGFREGHATTKRISRRSTRSRRTFTRRRRSRTST